MKIAAKTGCLDVVLCPIFLKVWHHISSLFLRKFNPCGVCSRLFAAAGNNSVKTHPETTPNQRIKSSETSLTKSNMLSVKIAKIRRISFFLKELDASGPCGYNDSRFTFLVLFARERIVTISNIEQIALNGPYTFKNR